VSYVRQSQRTKKKQGKSEEVTDLNIDDAGRVQRPALLVEAEETRAVCEEHRLTSQ
jgi:hypothetical protein